MLKSEIVPGAFFAHSKLGPKFRKADPSVRDHFFAMLKKRAHRVEAGTEIALEGDPIDSVIWVLDGWVAMTKGFDDGRVQMIDVVLPIDVILPLSADGRTSAYGIRALTDAIVAPYPKALMHSLRCQSEPLEELVGELDAAGRARRAERMLHLGHGSAYERVALALIEMYLRVRALDAGVGTEYHLPMTQQQIGEFTGLSGVHVCRTLGRLDKEGIISHPDHDILVHDLDALARIARVDLERYSEEIVPASHNGNMA